MLKNEIDITMNYDIKLIKYNDEIVEKRYFSPISRRLEGYEKVEKTDFKDFKTIKKIKLKKKGRQASNDNLKKCRNDSLTRTRNTLIDYALANKNSFKSFITLTFAENITDLTVANKKFENFVKSMRRACKKNDIDFLYLGVPEFQARGAVHYHLLTNLKLDSQFIVKQKDNEKCYDVKYWKHGFSSAFNLSLTDEKFNVALYICKYLYKDIDSRLFGRNKILKSNNLVSGQVEYINSEDITEKQKQVIDYINKNNYAVYEFIPTSEQLAKNKYLKASITYRCKKNKANSILLL